MKWSAFLLGGLVGAAAVVYMQKGKKSMMFAGMGNSTGDSVSKMLDKGKDQVMNGFDSSKSGMQQRNASKSASTDGKADIGKVEEIIKKDAAVKSQVDQILAENNQKDSYQSH
jgi:hypothetical protein